MTAHSVNLAYCQSSNCTPSARAFEKTRSPSTALSQKCFFKCLNDGWS